MTAESNEKDRTFRTYAEKRARSASDEERQAVEVFSLAAWGERQQAIPPVERCQTCIHPEGYDRLSGPCPTCDGAGAIPPGGESDG